MDNLEQLLEEVKRAEETYYELDYQYKKKVDDMNLLQSQLLLDNERITGRTQKEKESQINLLLQDQQEEKRELNYKVSQAKVKMNYLQRKYQLYVLGFYGKP